MWLLILWLLVLWCGGIIRRRLNAGFVHVVVVEIVEPRQDGAAYFYNIGGAQSYGADDALSVDKGAVAAIQVLDKVIPVAVVVDSTVVSTYVGVVDDNCVVVVATNCY